MFKNLLLVSTLALVVVGCGGGGGGGDGASSQPTPNTGILEDGPVSGIKYKTATQSGVTDSQGHYSYLDNETVTFSIGGINFPSTTARSIVTPLDMVGKTDLTDTTVINILRLLQSLDVDGDPSNGIQISSAANAAATGLSIAFTSPTFDTDVANLVANSGSVTNTLLSADIAVNHFKKTLSTQTIDWSRYFNYADKRQWNYTLTSGGPENLYEYVIDGTANGQDVFIHGWDPNWDSSGTLEYVSKDMSNGRRLVGIHENGVDHFFKTPTLLGCNNLYESCTLTGTLDGMNYSFTYINELATVTVPAGTYNDCIKTNQTDNINNVTRISWLCRNVGLAKSEKVGDFVYELTSITTHN